MKKNLSEIVFLLDRSGSMSGLESDTIGGFNSLIAKQKRLGKDAFISTILFNQNSLVLHDRVLLEQIKPMTEADYTACGSTALLDAIGGAIHHIGMIHKYARNEDIPEHTLFVITTDGLENASTRYTLGEIREMICQRKERQGWEFLFLGANIDAIGTAESLGVKRDRAVHYHSDPQGTRLNYTVLSDTILTIREGMPLSPNWKEKSKTTSRQEQSIPRNRTFPLTLRACPRNPTSPLKS